MRTASQAGDTSLESACIKSSLSWSVEAKPCGFSSRVGSQLASTFSAIASSCSPSLFYCGSLLGAPTSPTLTPAPVEHPVVRSCIQGTTDLRQQTQVWVRHLVPVNVKRSQVELPAPVVCRYGHWHGTAVRYTLLA